MMYKCWIIFFVLVFANCSPGRNTDKEGADYGMIESLLPDSIFYEKAVKEFKASSAGEALKNRHVLVKLSDDLKRDLTKCLNKDDQLLEAYYYSSYDNSEYIIPIVVLMSTMESNSFILLIIDRDFRIVSCTLLTEDNCSLIDQDDEKEIIWCNTREAYLNDNNLKLIEKHIEEVDFGSYSAVKKDSVISIYKIDARGNFFLSKKDSVGVDSK